MKIVKRGIDNLIKNTKEFIEKVKTEHLIREYFKNNVLFVTFVITRYGKAILPTVLYG